MHPKLILLVPILFIAAGLVPWFALGALRRTWKKDCQSPTKFDLCGGALATILIRRNEIRGIGVVERGKLFFDHYDPFAGDVNLSEPVYRGKSPAALAHAAIYAGQVILHAGNDKRFRRLVLWNRITRLIANVLPVIFLILLFTPGGFRLMPIFTGALVLLLAAQLLTLPAFSAAGQKSRAVISEYDLFSPVEFRAFSASLKSVNYRHLAAPVLECFWLRFLF